MITTGDCHQLDIGYTTIHVRVMMKIEVSTNTEAVHEAFAQIMGALQESMVDKIEHNNRAVLTLGEVNMVCWQCTWTLYAPKM